MVNLGRRRKVKLMVSCPERVDVEVVVAMLVNHDIRCAGRDLHPFASTAHKLEWSLAAPITQVLLDVQKVVFLPADNGLVEPPCLVPEVRLPIVELPCDIHPAFTQFKIRITACTKTESNPRALYEIPACVPENKRRSLAKLLERLRAVFPEKRRRRSLCPIACEAYDAGSRGIPMRAKDFAGRSRHAEGGGMMEALYMVAKKPTIGNVPNREALFEPIGKVAIGGVRQTSNMKPTYNE